MTQLTGQNITFQNAAKSPLLSHFLHEKRYSIILLAAVSLHLALSWIGLWSWECPSQAVGIECPGCGLTRSILLLLTGNITAALHQHLFSPIAIAFGLMLLINIVLQNKARKQYLNYVRRLEMRTRFIQVILSLWAVYWIFNLLF